MTETTEAPQPLRGWVTTTYVKQGSHRFGPYHVRVWKQDGKTHKQYIKPGEVEKVRAACQAHRELRKEGQRITEVFNNQVGNLNWLYRMNRRLDKNRELREQDWNFLEQIDKRGFAISGRPSLRTRRPGFTRRLMVPFLTKRQLANFNKAVDEILDQRRAQESPQNKWQRWHEELKAQPEAPKPYFEPLKEITEEQIAQTIEEFAAAIKAGVSKRR